MNVGCVRLYKRSTQLGFSSDPGLKVRHLRKPGQNEQTYRVRPGIAGVSTGVASFTGDFLIGIF